MKNHNRGNITSSKKMKNNKGGIPKQLSFEEQMTLFLASTAAAAQHVKIPLENIESNGYKVEFQKPLSYFRKKLSGPGADLLFAQRCELVIAAGIASLISAGITNFGATLKIINAAGDLSEIADLVETYHRANQTDSKLREMIRDFAHNFVQDCEKVIIDLAYFLQGTSGINGGRKIKRKIRELASRHPIAQLVQGDR